ncbi:MAG TPA: transposase, partial [Desulfobaccales bacterium]
MEPIYTCCCGLDVHRRSVAACVRRLEAGGRLYQETRTFGTMTRDILELADWLAAGGVTHVAMEATGVYWKPIYNLLEDRFTLLLV